jgi:hypothetical protein
MRTSPFKVDPSAPKGAPELMGRLMRTVAVVVISAAALHGTSQASATQIKVVFVGDSLSDGIGAAVQRHIARDACLAERVQISRKAEIGTGLARADRFHWPEKVRTITAETGADLVVASFGLNDRTGVVDNTAGIRVAFGSSEWQARYADQVSAFLRGAASAQAGTLWLGIPSLRDQVANEDGISKNTLYKSVIASLGTGKVSFVEPWRITNETPEPFQSYWTDPNGSKVQVRAPDGIHFTGAGYDLIARHLSPKIVEHLKAQLGPERLGCEGQV